MATYGYVWSHMKVCDKALLKYPAAVQPFVEGTLCVSMVMYGCVWSHMKVFDIPSVLLHIYPLGLFMSFYGHVWLCMVT